jgi:hypothetical protein
MFLFAAPAFAEYPWGEEPGNGNGKAGDMLDEYPWVGGRGKGKNAEGLLDENPWGDGRGKGKNAEGLLDEHPWIGGGKGKGGAGAGVDWTTYIRSYLRIFY